MGPRILLLLPVLEFYKERFLCCCQPERWELSPFLNTLDSGFSPCLFYVVSVSHLPSERCNSEAYNYPILEELWTAEEGKKTTWMVFVQATQLMLIWIFKYLPVSQMILGTSTSEQHQQHQFWRDLLVTLKQGITLQWELWKRTSDFPCKMVQMNKEPVLTISPLAAGWV